MTRGFHVAMYACAAIATVGGVLAWLEISDDALVAGPAARGEPPVEVSTHYTCPVTGPPWRSGRERVSECETPAVEPPQH
jgi:hypothetical protein